MFNTALRIRQVRRLMQMKSFVVHFFLTIALVFEVRV